MDDFIISRFDTDVTDLKIIYSYSVGLCKVFITNIGEYIVQEPKLSVEGEKIWKKLRSTIHYSFTHQELDNNQIVPLLKKHLEDESKKSSDFETWKTEKDAVEYYLDRDLVGHEEIDVLIKDKYIEDILCVSWDKPIGIVHNKFPQFPLLKTNIIFQSEDRLEKLIQRTAQKRGGDPPTDVKPMTSFTDKSRIRYTLTGNKTITPEGPTMSIRKPSIDNITIYHLLSGNVMSVLAAAYLWLVMDLKGFGVIIGATAAGKTTMINALFTMSNPQWHYFTIEDVLELKLLHQYVSKHQTTTNSSLQGEGIGNYSVGIFDLYKLSLRFKPDFVIVGEVLGQESEGLFQAAASGSGCMTSFHATDTRHALTRFESPPINISKTQTSLISYFLHISQIMKDNKRYRRVLSITEPIPIPDSKELKKKIYTIFNYDPILDKLMPDDVESVIKNSELLQKATILLGKSDIVEDLKKRVNILQRILDNKISDPKLIFNETIKYYTE